MQGNLITRRLAIVALCLGAAILLGSCFGSDEDANGPTTDTGGDDSNTVVTLAPPPQPPVTSIPEVIQPPPPSTTQPVPSAPPTTERELGAQLLYTINPGDTLFSIAQQFGTTVDELVALNNIENPDAIQAGDQLFIPPTS